MKTHKACQWITLCLAALMITVQPLWAKEKNTIAVLPFSVNSAENIDYVRQGIGDMLSSRISVSEKIDVINRDTVLAVLKESGGKDPTLSDAYALGKKLNTDFVVWGSITKIGNGLNIDGRLLDVAANKSAVAAFVQCQNMDEVIPKINEFAQKIENHILGAPSQTVSAAPPTSREIIVSRQPAPTPPTSREAEIISGMKGSRKGTFTSTINPDFINAEQPLNRETFWKSQQLNYEVRGMDVGDVNGDGINETVLIDPHNIYIYQKKGAEFKLLQQIPGNRYDSFISIDIADINRNGIKEIIVSSYAGLTVDSFIMEYKNGKFENIGVNLPWFMRVVDNGSGTPFLIGQRRGMDRPFETPIYEIVWQNGEYREGQKMRIPEGLSVFSLTLDKLGSSGKDVVIALNESDYLCVFEQTDKPLSKLAVFGGSEELRWKSEDPYGGSNTFIEPMDQSPREVGDATNKQLTYINLRVVTFDTNKDGKREIIIVKNASSTARTFHSIKLFSSAEVYNLEWDGIGMVENWRTKKISGYVADFQFRDIDNDGEKEVVLALVMPGGALSKPRSVVVVYQLKAEKS